MKSARNQVKAEWAKSIAHLTTDESRSGNQSFAGDCFGDAVLSHSGRNFMKRCPTCNRVETDEALKFCRVDGTVLINDTASDQYSATQILPDSHAISHETAQNTAGAAARIHNSELANLQFSPSVDEVAAAGDRRWIRPSMVVASVAVLAIIIGGIVLGVYLHARNSEVAIDSIAVLPFENRSSDADTDYLPDGLAESLIYRLSQLPNLKVSPTSTILRYKGQPIDPVKIGKDLGVSAVLSGRITQHGDNLTISAELVDIRYNKLLWGEQYDRKMSELLSTQREMAREIVDSLKLKVSGEERGLAKHYTESNEAYQLYMKGRFYFSKRTQEGMQKALANFNAAIEKDPTFALAYAGVADTYDLAGSPDAGGTMPPRDALPKAREAAIKSIELDPTLAEPHVSLGHIKYYYDRDWTGAEREFKRAIELNPNYPQAHQWYSLLLVWQGRTDEGIAEVKRAQQLDPLSLPIGMAVGWLLCDANRTDEGIDALKKTLELDPNFIAAHHRLALCYEHKGMSDAALAESKKIDELGARPLAVALAGHIYAVMGRREEAARALAELQEQSKERYVSPAMIAVIYAALGDKDQAFAWLQKSIEEYDLMATRLKADYRYAPLRSDPRFAELIKRVGLPQR